MCLAAALTLKKKKKNFSCFPESARHGFHTGRSENMAAVVRLLPSIRPQMASLTPPLLIFQRALCGHHLEKRGRGKNWWRGRVLLKRRGAAKVSKKIAAKHSPNNRFPNTLSEGVGCRCNPGVQQQRASEFSCQYPMFEISEAHSPLPCPPPLLMPSSLFTLLFISLLVPLPPPLSLQPLPSLPCAEARVKFTTTVKVRDDR